ncbi:hypothetical protein Osc7112_5429 [Oscillatoria nigro-viridis PCC 7112]|uniref:Uncharacterized protein n=1 Tax=Phormidium nigroviride PCC 7112 TaxID=179408 RepID=K9VR28_9CYAN|nr:hypothetical protein Osc7112_5429 [Oscillatoria nigro-viridis PCC 7112]
MLQYGSLKENCSENVGRSETEGSFLNPTYALLATIKYFRKKPGFWAPMRAGL